MKSSPVRLLLVNPWIYDFAAYDMWVKPVGLLCVAAFLKSCGCKIDFFDCLDDITTSSSSRAHSRRRESGRGHFHKTPVEKPLALKNIPRTYSRYGVPAEQFIEYISTIAKPDAVLVSSIMTYWYPGVQEVIRLIKDSFPDVPVILGGIYATLCPEHAHTSSGADYVYCGSVRPDLAKLLERVTGKNLFNKRDADYLQPEYGLLRSFVSLPLITSRGCPFRCTYCASKLIFDDFIQYEYEKILELILQYARENGTSNFTFFDDALLVNADRHFMPLVKGIISNNLHVRFHTPNGLHARYITPDIADCMMHSGFATVRIGFETSDAQLQNTTGDKVSRNEYMRAARALLKAGFTSGEAGAYVLAGLPNQTYNSVRETVRFVQESGLRPHVAEYSPIPGTALWDHAVASSRYPLADEPLFHNNTLLPCTWDGFTHDHLQAAKEESRKRL